VEEDQVLFAENSDGVIDLSEGAHAGGEDDGLTFGAGVAEEAVIGERSGGNFEAGEIEFSQVIESCFVSGGDEPGHFDLFTVSVDLTVVLDAEFEAAFEIAICGAEGGGAGGGELGLRVDDIDGTLLELDGIAAGGYGDTDETAGDIEIAIVVNAYLGEDQAGKVIAHQLAAEGYGFGWKFGGGDHGRTFGIAPLYNGLVASQLID